MGKNYRGRDYNPKDSYNYHRALDRAEIKSRMGTSKPVHSEPLMPKFSFFDDKPISSPFPTPAAEAFIPKFAAPPPSAPSVPTAAVSSMPSTPFPTPAAKAFKPQFTPPQYSLSTQAKPRVSTPAVGFSTPSAKAFKPRFLDAGIMSQQKSVITDADQWLSAHGYDPETGLEKTTNPRLVGTPMTGGFPPGYKPAIESLDADWTGPEGDALGEPDDYIDNSVDDDILDKSFDIADTDSAFARIEEEVTQQNLRQRGVDNASAPWRGFYRKVKALSSRYDWKPKVSGDLFAGLHGDQLGAKVAKYSVGVLRHQIPAGRTGLISELKKLNAQYIADRSIAADVANTAWRRRPYDVVASLGADLTRFNKSAEYAEDLALPSKQRGSLYIDRTRVNKDLEGFYDAADTRLTVQNDTAAWVRGMTNSINEANMAGLGVESLGDTSPDALSPFAIPYAQAQIARQKIQGLRKKGYTSIMSGFSDEAIASMSATDLMTNLARNLHPAPAIYNANPSLYGIDSASTKTLYPYISHGKYEGYGDEKVGVGSSQVALESLARNFTSPQSYASLHRDDRYMIDRGSERRIKRTDEDGNVILGRHGRPLYERNEDGTFKMETVRPAQFATRGEIIAAAWNMDAESDDPKDERSKQANTKIRFKRKIEGEEGKDWKISEVPESMATKEALSSGIVQKTYGPDGEAHYISKTYLPGKGQKEETDSAYMYPYLKGRYYEQSNAVSLRGGHRTVTDKAGNKTTESHAINTFLPDDIIHKLNTGAYGRKSSSISSGDIDYDESLAAEALSNQFSEKKPSLALPAPGQSTIPLPEFAGHSKSVRKQIDKALNDRSGSGPAIRLGSLLPPTPASEPSEVAPVIAPAAGSPSIGGGGVTGGGSGGQASNNTMNQLIGAIHNLSSAVQAAAVKVEDAGAHSKGSGERETLRKWKQDYINKHPESEEAKAQAKEKLWEQIKSENADAKRLGFDLTGRRLALGAKGPEWMSEFEGKNGPYTVDKERAIISPVVQSPLKQPKPRSLRSRRTSIGGSGSLNKAESWGGVTNFLADILSGGAAGKMMFDKVSPLVKAGVKMGEHNIDSAAIPERLVGLSFRDIEDARAMSRGLGKNARAVEESMTGAAMRVGQMYSAGKISDDVLLSGALSGRLKDITSGEINPVDLYLGLGQNYSDKLKGTTDLREKNKLLYQMSNIYGAEFTQAVNNNASDPQGRTFKGQYWGRGTDDSAIPGTRENAPEFGASIQNFTTAVDRFGNLLMGPLANILDSTADVIKRLTNFIPTAGAAINDFNKSAGEKYTKAFVDPIIQHFSDESTAARKAKKASTRAAYIANEQAIMSGVGSNLENLSGHNAANASAVSNWLFKSLSNDIFVNNNTSMAGSATEGKFKLTVDIQDNGISKGTYEIPILSNSGDTGPIMNTTSIPLLRQ